MVVWLIDFDCIHFIRDRLATTTTNLWWLGEVRKYQATSTALSAAVGNLKAAGRAEQEWMQICALPAPQGTYSIPTSCYYKGGLFTAILKPISGSVQSPQ